MSIYTCRKCSRPLPESMFVVVKRGVAYPDKHIPCSDCRPVRTPAQRMAAAVNQHKSRAKALGVISTLTVLEWQRILEASSGKCFHCKAIVGIDALGIDHLIPLAKGGPNAAGNVVAACWPCNNSKGKKVTQEILNGGFLELTQCNVVLDTETIANIATLQERFGGASRSAIIRLAVLKLLGSNTKRNPLTKGSQS